MDIRTLCLGILSLGDATGYEIKKMVGEGSFSFFSEASFGSIYPALTKLTDEGLITCRQQTQDNRPDKKIYSLTKLGVNSLEKALEDTQRPDRNRSDFLAAILFAEAIAPERIDALVVDRKQYHEGQIRILENMLDPDTSAASRFVIEYGLTMQRAALKFLKNNNPKN